MNRGPPGLLPHARKPSGPPTTPPASPWHCSPGVREGPSEPRRHSPLPAPLSAARPYRVWGRRGWRGAGSQWAGGGPWAVTCRRPAPRGPWAQHLSPALSTRRPLPTAPPPPGRRTLRPSHAPEHCRHAPRRSAGTPRPLNILGPQFTLPDSSPWPTTSCFLLVLTSSSSLPLARSAPAHGTPRRSSNAPGVVLP